VRGLRADRAGGRLLVSFDRVPGAERYVVLATLRDGLRTDDLITRHSLTISVPAVGPPGGSVAVLALGDGLSTTNGSADSVRIKVPARPRTRHRKHTHRR
jgi:hypothetical protein